LFWAYRKAAAGKPRDAARVKWMNFKKQIKKDMKAIQVLQKKNKKKKN